MTYATMRQMIRRVGLVCHVRDGEIRVALPVSAYAPMRLRDAMRRQESQSYYTHDRVDAVLTALWMSDQALT